MFQFFVENWRISRHILKNTARIEIIITISTATRRKKNKNFGPSSRAIFHTYCYYDSEECKSLNSPRVSVNKSVFWGKYRHISFCFTSVLGTLAFAVNEIFKIIHHSNLFVRVLFESWHHSRASPFQSVRYFWEYDVIYSNFTPRIGTRKINGGCRFTEIMVQKNSAVYTS